MAAADAGQPVLSAQGEAGGQDGLTDDGAVELPAKSTEEWRYGLTGILQPTQRNPIPYFRGTTLKPGGTKSA